MVRRPAVLRGVVARLRGEVSGASLEAFARAGAPAYGLHAELSARRSASSIADPWLTAPAEQAEVLCAWNAFVLQTFADALVAADYDRSPATAGFVPPGLGRTARRLYREVADWLVRASRARASPAYALDVDVPRPFPDRVSTRATVAVDAHALAAAFDAVVPHAWTTLHEVVAASPPERSTKLEPLHELLAAATASADYAASLLRANMPAELNAEATARYRTALADVYVLGQLLAMPALLEDGGAWRAGLGSVRARLPGEPGFDEWCLTRAHERARRRLDYTSQRLVSALWAADPDPARTVSLVEEIGGLWSSALIDEVSPGPAQIHRVAERCPWPATWFAVEPIVVRGVELGRLDLFTILVSADRVGAGGAFKRALVVSPRSRPLQPRARPVEPSWGLGSPLDQLFEVYDV